MARIAIARKHTLTHRKAREAAQKVADDLKKRFALNYEWKDDTIAFHRPGLRGEMHVGKTDIRLDAELGLLLTVLKPAIEQEVDKEFAKRFGKA